eukprot:1502296-Rhodomonas_salina.1
MEFTEAVARQDQHGEKRQRGTREVFRVQFKVVPFCREQGERSVPRVGSAEPRNAAPTQRVLAVQQENVQRRRDAKDAEDRSH